MKQANPSPDDAPNPQGENNARGPHRATDVLRAVLGDTGLPAGDAAVYEGLVGLARAAQAISGWIPDAHVWRDLASHLHEQAAARTRLKGAYSSGIAPSRLHPLHGDFRTFPLYAGIVAGEQVPDSTAWAFVAGLACWPFMQATLRGLPPPTAQTNAVSSIYSLLRDATASGWLDRLLEGVDTPESLLEAIARLPAKEQKSSHARGLTELAHQFLTQQETQLPQELEDEDDLLPSKYKSLVTNQDQDNAGLAPDDYGAAQSVLEIEGNPDPVVVRARTIGAARDFKRASNQMPGLVMPGRSVSRCRSTAPESLASIACRGS